jgi:8-amino-7-oxononanoate synthase
MTSTTALAVYRAALEELADKSRLRTLAPRTGLDFASNDYLALASSNRLREAVRVALARGVPVGASGSRLLRGNAPEHEELEATAADFFHSERTLYFGGGYVANFAVLSTLPQKGDLIVLDALAHASANEGARAGRAEIAKALHNDAEAFEAHAVAAGGSGWPSRASTVWMAIALLLSTSWRSPNTMMRYSTSTRRMPRASAALMDAGSRPHSKVVRMFSRYTPAAKRSAAPARS